jgi:hypothetical protein
MIAKFLYTVPWKYLRKNWEHIEGQKVKKKVPLKIYLQVHLFQGRVSICFMQLDLGSESQKD